MKIPQKPQWLMWDHNIHYHPSLVRHIPPGAKRAIDVGCGAGLFAERVAETIPEVVAIDRDPAMIRTASSASRDPGIQYLTADAMEADLPLGSFDFVSCLSALHHMPLQAGLERLRSFLAPGGILVVLGLYKVSTPFDYAYVGITGLVDLAVGLVRHRTQAPVRRCGGVVLDWHDTLHEIRNASHSVLPGAQLRRHMYDRYSVVYRHPRGEAVDAAEVAAPRRERRRIRSVLDA